MDIKEELKKIQEKINAVNKGSAGLGASTVMIRLQARKKELQKLL